MRISLVAASVGLAAWAGMAGESVPAGKSSASVPGAQLGEPKDRQFTADYDGSVQRYMLLLPKDFDASQQHDLMIALHGHNSTRAQYATDRRGECAGARDVAARFGMIFVSPDYRGNSWMGPAAEADLVQLIGLLRREFGIGKVILVGGSMGGTSVLTFAALHSDLVDGVSSQNGAANLLEYDVTAHGIADAIKDSFGGHKDETPAQYKTRNDAEYRKRSAEFQADKFSMPIAFTTGGKDTLVPPASTLRLAERVRRHNRDVLLIHRPETGHQTDFADTVAAIEFVVKAARAKP